MAVDGYRQRCAELATVTARRDADLGEAEQSYVDDCAALTVAVATAEANLSTVDGTLRAVRRRVGRVDAEAAALWARAGELVGTRRLGGLPTPVLSTVDAVPGTVLKRVEAALRRYRLGPARVRLPRRFVAALPVLGALGAALTVLCGQTFGVPVAGLVLGPLPGLLVARTVARKGYGAWLDVGAIALTTLGALLAGGAAVLVTS